MLPKTSGKGIKIDTAAPTFAWVDLLGAISIRSVGATDPSYNVYRGGIRGYQFDANEEVFVEFHLPHDYVPGSDIHLHFHHSINGTNTAGASAGTVNGGTTTWGAEVSYAKGHNQAAFSAPITTTVVSTTTAATLYQHYITEVQLSAASPSASQLDSDDLEVDGLILVLGVPFAWTFRLFVPWLFTTVLLLAIYVLWDLRAHARETRADLKRDFYEVRRLRVAGKENLVLLLGVIGAVAFLREPWREAAIVGLAALSFRRTDPALRKATHFTFHPILEVAALFAGIFVTMLPAIDLLHARGAELGVREPWQFFWATGALSSFLDSAPTYLTFLALGQGLGLPSEVVGVPHRILGASSLGAVFMGANTYIGNGPNLGPSHRLLAARWQDRKR